MSLLFLYFSHVLEFQIIFEVEFFREIITLM